MSWMHSRLLGVAVRLFLLLVGAFISYQFNRENRLHMIALQNELENSSSSLIFCKSLCKNCILFMVFLKFQLLLFIC